jgi:DNA-binding transcriptional LysR family regulator
MMLTHEGQALLRYCVAARDLEGETLAQISGATERASVEVCITGPSSIMRSRVAPSCLAVLKQFPEIAMRFEVNDFSPLEDALRTGMAQMAILAPERVGREVDSKVLKPERYVLVGAKSWKGRAISEVIQRERIIDFDPSDTMTFSYLKKFGFLDGVRPDRHFMNNTEALVTMFEEGLGYGVLTLEFAQPYLKRGKLVLLNSGKVYENRVALAWYPRPKMAKYFRALIDAIH